ncbi:MAG: diguanylate cyclase [Pseudomonadota bacterium]
MPTENSVTAKARIVYIGGDEGCAALTLPFADAGYELVLQRHAGGADIGLIDLRGRQVTDEKAKALATLLRKSAPECAILIIIDPFIDEQIRKTLRKHGELIAMQTQPDGLIERCRKTIRLRNIAEETGERLKTLASLNRLSQFPPIAAPAMPLRVLIAGAPGPAALAAVNALVASVEKCVCVFSAGQALRATETASFDAAIFLPAQRNDPLLSLARSLRRHPKHASMPIIFPINDPDEAAALSKRGASDFLLTSHIASELCAKVQVSARRARLLKSMRRFLQTCEGEGIRDMASGAFTVDFLAEHGARLCARADQHGRPLAIGTIFLEKDGAGSLKNTSDKQALHQATRLINRVTRAEDVAVRVASDTFILLMPATTEENAAKAGLRIQGVLENTVFRSPNDETLYSVRANVTACARPAAFCIEESVALALAVLRESKTATALSRQFPQ